MLLVFVLYIWLGRGSDRIEVNNGFKCYQLRLQIIYLDLVDLFKDATIMKMIRIIKMNKATLCFLAAKYR